MTLGTATEVEEIVPITEQRGKAQVNQLVSNENTQWRKDKLCALLDRGESALLPRNLNKC